MRLKRAVPLALMFAVLSLNSGCGLYGLSAADPRLTDGGGGDLVSAGFKAVRGALTLLTQDEVQQLSDKVNEVVRLANPAVNLPPLTNAQADAFLAFLQVNSVPGSKDEGLNSLEDLRLFAEAALSDPNVVVFPPGFLEEFSDQLNVVDISELDLDLVFGGVFGAP